MYIKILKVLKYRIELAQPIQIPDTYVSISSNKYNQISKCICISCTRKYTAFNTRECEFIYVRSQPTLLPPPVLYLPPPSNLFKVFSPIHYLHTLDIFSTAI